MTAYHDQLFPGPLPRVGTSGRPVNTHRLWVGGVATAVVAALIAVIGVLVVRAILRIEVYAPGTAGTFGGAGTVLLCAAAAVAALAATGVAHVLLTGPPRPLSYLNWTVGLATAAAVLLPLVVTRSLPVALAQSIIHLVIGLAIGSLLTGAAAAATCPMHRASARERFEIE